MRYLFFLTLVLPLLSHSQDLIVTTSGDSLNCKITKNTSDEIHYLYQKNDEINSGIIQRKNVKIFIKNYFNKAEIDLSQVNMESKYTAYKLRFFYGSSRMIAKTHPDFPKEHMEYLEELKRGHHFGIDFSYYPSDGFGYGLTFRNFISNNSKTVFRTDSITMESEKSLMQDNISVYFAGFGLYTRTQSFDIPVVFHFQSALGVFGLKNDSKYFEDILVTGSSIGLLLGGTMEIKLIKNLSFELSPSLFWGTIKRLEVDTESYSRAIELTGENAENISRFDLSFGLSWNY